VIYENASCPQDKRVKISPTDFIFSFLYEYLLALANIFLYIFGSFDYRAWFESKEGPGISQPVILLHGYMMNSGCMVYIYQKLKMAGFKNVYPINLGPKIASIEVQAGKLSEIVAHILEKTSEKSASIIAHSQGGLISRYYIKFLDGSDKVDKLITLGTPHNGTKLSIFGIGRNSREMLPDSQLLRELNSKQESSRTRVLSIYSPVDNMVLPYYSSYFDGGENFISNPLGHFGILFSKSVITKIQDFLKN